MRRTARRLGVSRLATDRRVELALPRPPDGRRAPESITMVAPRVMYVPRRLQMLGLGGYEPEPLACFLAAVDLAPPGVVLDVGANVGIYGLLARALSNRDVRAFEPVPDLAAVARRIAANNRLNYPVETAAVGREPGEATLYLSDVTDSSNSLNPRFRSSSRSITVPVTTLDAYVEEQGLVPAVVKIDTETGEPDVLGGAQRILATHRPWLFVEVLPRRVEAALMAELAPWGYSWYRCVGRPPYVASPDFGPLDGTQAPMWALLPEPATDEFWDRAREWQDALAHCVPPDTV